MASPSPTTAPTSISGGGASTGFGGGAWASSIGAAATARGGGRRVAEKIGRSWVPVSADSGTDQSGLPRGAGLLVAGAGRAIGLTAPTSRFRQD